MRRKVVAARSMSAESAQARPKVLIIGTQRLVLDNVRVLLRTMGCHCIVGSSPIDALPLLEKEKPDAAVLDSQLPVSSSAEIVMAMHSLLLRLQGRAVVLTREESDPQLLKVFEAYSLPKVPVDLVFQEVWPCLDSLLHHRNTGPMQAKRSARLVFDSFLQPLPEGIRSAQPADHTLLYEAGDVMIDVWLEPHKGSNRVKLLGQVLHELKPGSQLHCAPVVLQTKAEPIGATITNEEGEFQLDFDPHPDLKLEIGVKENHWVSVELPTSKEAIQESKEEWHAPEKTRATDIREDLFSRKRKRR